MQKKAPEHSGAAALDLDAILKNPYGKEGACVTFRQEDVYDFQLEQTLDQRVLLKKFAPALKKGEPASVSLKVGNTDRTFGTILGAEITRKYPHGLPEDTLTVNGQVGAEITRKYPHGLPEDTLTVNGQGAGGQSFGAFIPRGLTLKLEGDTNDYFGKGLSTIISAKDCPAAS